MWDLPRPGLEPVSPALAGRLSTTAPPGKPHQVLLNRTDRFRAWWTSASSLSPFHPPIHPVWLHVAECSWVRSVPEGASSLYEPQNGENWQLIKYSSAWELPQPFSLWGFVSRCSGSWGFREQGVCSSCIAQQLARSHLSLSTAPCSSPDPPFPSLLPQGTI